MFLREKKIYNNNQTYTYLQIVESVKKKGKVKQNVLLNFGNITYWPPEKMERLIDDLALYTGYHHRGGLSEGDIDPQGTLDYGAHLLLDIIWKQLSLGKFWKRYLSKRVLGFEVEMAIKAMVYNRLTDPKSKLALDEWIKRQYIPGVDPDMLKVHHYYRALDVVAESKDEFEEWVYAHITNLLNFDLSLVFYDLTSSYFEGEGPEIACPGYSRDNRPDCNQIQIGLLVNSDGIPISHVVFDGAVSDQRTLPEVISQMLSRFNIKQCIFVADDGIVNTATMSLVRDAGYKTIYSASMHKEKSVQDILEQAPEFNSRSSPWKKIKDNLWVWELPEKIDGYRITIAFNPIRQKSQRVKRERWLTESKSYLNSFNAKTKRGAKKNNQKVEMQIDKWLRRKGTRKYFEFSRKGPYRLKFSQKESAIQKTSAVDGMMVLRTDSEKLSTAEVALGYRTLTQVEAAFKEIKNFIKLRPIRHWTDLRVKGHVAVCVMAYLIESILDNLLTQSKIRMTARRALGLFSSLTVVKLNLAGKQLYKTTQPTEDQLELLRIIGLSKFERILTKT